jgi:rubrerythrin
MRSKSINEQEIDRIHDVAAQWGKIIAKHAFGENGPGLDVDFRTFEKVAQAAAQGLLEGTLEHLSKQQAEKVPPSHPCPDCGRLCSIQTEERKLVVPGGTIEQTEAKAHCPTCRRDFFPPTDHARSE